MARFGRRRGFTLVEIMVVVAIIVVMMTVSLLSLAAGRSAAHAKEACRGVSQMSHYANALALLRQRPVIVTYAGNKISVQLSGKPQDLSELGPPALPIYREVNSQEAVLAEAEEADEEPLAKGNDPSVAEKTGLFFTRQVLDPEELAKEDAEREFDDVSFELELLDDDGIELDEETGARLLNQADSLAATRGPVSVWSNVHGEMDLDEAKRGPQAEEVKPKRVIFETNGNCTPHRVTIRERHTDGDESTDGQELMVLSVSRSGKVTIAGEDDKPSRSRSRRHGRR